MSWQASLWAATLPHKRVAHIPFRVLMLLADHAHDDGKNIWRANSSLAAVLEVSERTIQRAIRELKDQGLIVPGDQRLTSHLPEHRRPVVYDLMMHQPWSQPTTLDGAESAPVGELSTGVTDLSGVTTAVVSSKEEPPLDITKALKADHTAAVAPCPKNAGGVHRFAQPSGYCPCGLRDDGYRINLETGRTA